MRNIFTEHPSSVNETYFQHLRFATLFGVKMLIGGMACIIHAILPFCFQKTGSRLLLNMTKCFIERTTHPNDSIIQIQRVIERKGQNT
jgi:hypothetical protein